MNIAAQYDVDLKYALDNQLICDDTYISLRKKIIRYQVSRAYQESNSLTNNKLVKIFNLLRKIAQKKYLIF